MQAEFSHAMPRAPGLEWVARAFRPGNLAPTTVWWFLIIVQVTSSGFPPSVTTLGLILVNGVFLVLFMIRRDAIRQGGLFDLAMALGGTCLVALLKDPETFGTPSPVPLAIQLAGIAGWIWALLSLGRSFGLVAADRGLVRRGPYRAIRHPIYAFEILYFLGYLAAVPSPRSLVVIAVWIGFQCVRIFREERIIEGYREYAGEVRWRLLPFVW